MSIKKNQSYTIINVSCNTHESPLVSILTVFIFEQSKHPVLFLFTTQRQQMFPDGSSSDLTLEVTLQSLTRQNVNTELHTVHIHTNAKFTKVVFTRKNLNIQHLQKYQKRITEVRIRYQLSTISNAFPCITNRLKPFKHTQTRSMESFMIGETIEELSVRVKAGY